MRHLYYILDEDKNPIECDMMTWAKMFNQDRHVAQHVIDIDGVSVRISTVFLGLDHSWGDGPPILFETMIFGGEHDQYQERYSTWHDAWKGHYKAIELLFEVNINQTT